MELIYHPASSRGHADHGWLKSSHSFSFASYYNPDRIRFGLLRVLNDDEVAPGMGFGLHPHDNMEIISIPLFGDLEHRDSMGNIGVIKEGDVQVMSAGTGIEHSEYNKNKDKEVHFLQIWVFPKHKNVSPRYDQTSIPKANSDTWTQLVSPNEDDEGAWINQDAWFHLGRFDSGSQSTYDIKHEGNGLYVFVLEGKLKIEDQELSKRDGLGIISTDKVQFNFTENSKVLLLEVPMN